VFEGLMAFVAVAGGGRREAHVTVKRVDGVTINEARNKGRHMPRERPSGKCETVRLKRLTMQRNLLVSLCF
jgi:hypothetical protein